MKWCLLLLALGNFAVGGLFMIGVIFSPVAAIAGLLLWVIAAILLVGAAIVEAVNNIGG